MGSGALKCLCSEEQEEIQEVDENKGEEDSPATAIDGS